MPQDEVLPQNTSELIALEIAIEYFLTAKEAQRCSPWTLRHYRWTLKRFIVWLAGYNITDASQLTPHHIRLFLADLQRQEMAAWTIHDFARVIKTFCRFLQAEELIPDNPMRRVAMPHMDDKILPAFASGDIQALLDACHNARDRAIILVLLDTGVRASEFCALNIENVDLKTGTVMVRHGKGGKDRAVFLGARSRKALTRYMARRRAAKPIEPLFSKLRGGGRLAVSGLQTLLLRLGRVAEVKNCHPHTFRRTFALWSLRAGMNVYALQRIMGHSDLTILRQYLALVEEDLATAHREHGAVDNML